ncbi:MAG: DNA internalization-related competence protein ComEC/Rec2 [Xanthomonadaceae bacterium]|nr:DNA internalization-related competence protein ComEC/Rec2 [Xanthomonadaceae bacterium]
MRACGVPLAGVAMLAGVVCVQALPDLPRGAMLVLACAGLAAASMACWLSARFSALGWLLLGVAWAMWCGAHAMDARLPRQLEGRDLVVTGQILDLPDARADGTRFGFRIESARLDGRHLAWHGRVRLAWYDRSRVLHPCERWRLRVRLKRPRGMIDPGGADAERSALQRRVDAVGYVREADSNRRQGQPACVDRLRARLAAAIEARTRLPHDAALLRALAVGDTRGLDQDDWAVARATGVSHLLAISGFHVGVAAAFGMAMATLLFALFPGLGLRQPRSTWQAALALLAAAGYGLLAGLGLPTLRTLLMIAVAVAARSRRRHLAGGHALAMALLAMLLADPLAVLSAGFWLSFVGVAFLMFCLDARTRGWRGFVRELSRGQWVMSVALLPLTLWFFGQASLVGALSNLVAVPVVSLLMVPLTLTAVLALLAWPVAAGPMLAVAAMAGHGLWWVLGHMASWPGASWYLPAVAPWSLAIAMLGALWLLGPRGTPCRWLGGLLFLPLLVPVRSPVPEGAFRAWVLDVGQGLSVIVRTHRHVLLYDAGARYPSGFDVGAAAVVPSLRALGVRRLDMLVISHGDNDHVGGAMAVLDAFPSPRRLSGEPSRMPVSMTQCTAGQSWRWDGVDFRVLNPVGRQPHDNDRSCVLLVGAAGDRLLLTGDITRRVEGQVAAAVPAGSPVVMTVPHHGSKTSSGAAFIASIRPELAVVSAGWHNRFGHPSPEVVARYAGAGVSLRNTAVTGALRLDFPADAPVRVGPGERLGRRRYWREH